MLSLFACVVANESNVLLVFLRSRYQARIFNKLGDGNLGSAVFLGLANYLVYVFLPCRDLLTLSLLFSRLVILHKHSGIVMGVESDCIGVDNRLYVLLDDDWFNVSLDRQTIEWCGVN